MDRVERAAMFREAECMLAEAADLLEAELKMSGMEARVGDVTDRIREIASNIDSWSLRNLALYMERLEDDPSWTQPFVSSKNLFDGKGI